MNKEVHHIIQAQIQTLDDPELHAGIVRKIEEVQLTAEYAIFSEFNNYIQLLGAASADWAEERVIDLISIRDDLIEITRDRKKNLNVKEGDIIFAEDIAPAMMVTLSHLNIGGIVLKKGGFTSHAVIFSQSLGIPCVINVTWDRFQLQADADAVVDGNEGQVIVYPDADQKKDFNSRKSERESRPMKCSPGQRSRASHAAGTPLPCGPMSNSWMNYPGLNKTVLADSDCFALKPFCLKRKISSSEEHTSELQSRGHLVRRPL